MKTLSFFFSLLRTSIRGSISQRGAFLLESVLMIANNLVFLMMWWIFFRQFKEIDGWTLTDMIALNAIGMGAYGLMQICFGGVKQLARVILNGDLDPFMTQPKNLLLHLTGSKSFSKGWGSLMTTLILIFLGKFFTLSAIILILISMFCGCLVFTGFGIIAHSLVFWLGPIESVAKRYCDSLFLSPSTPATSIQACFKWSCSPSFPLGLSPVSQWNCFVTLPG